MFLLFRFEPIHEKWSVFIFARIDAFARKILDAYTPSMLSPIGRNFGLRYLLESIETQGCGHLE